MGVNRGTILAISISQILLSITWASTSFIDNLKYDAKMQFVDPKLIAKSLLFVLTALSVILSLEAIINMYYHKHRQDDEYVPPSDNIPPSDV